MKKLLPLFVICLLSFPGSVLAGLNDGLVAYYPFNQNADDQSGNGHDGIVYGAYSTTDKFGNPDSAYGFDGENDLIDIPDAQDFHFRSAMTISAMVRPSRIEGTQTIMNKWYALDSYGLFLKDGEFVFSVAYPGTCTWGTTVEVSAPATPDVWTCVTGVYNGTTLTLYINGYPVATKAASGGPIQQSDRPIIIGSHPLWNVFKGEMDEIRLYNRALLPEEVFALCSIGVDIKPRSCPNPLNLKNKGVIPVALLGTDGFDVTRIDPATIQLGGVSPLRWAFADVGTPFNSGKFNCSNCNKSSGDGYTDLILKFDNRELVDAIDKPVDGECLFLVVTGNMKEEYGGASLQGGDVVKIIKKGTK